MKELLERIADRCATHERLLGRLTLLFSLVIGLVGFPAQIYKNYQEHTCGLSIVIILAGLLMYLVRIPYLTGKRTWYMLPTEIIGLISVLVLLYQWWIYASTTPSGVVF